jgi:phage-related protein
MTTETIYIVGDAAEFEATMQQIAASGEEASASIDAAFDSMAAQVDAVFAEMSEGAAAGMAGVSAEMGAVGTEAAAAMSENVAAGTEGLADELGAAGLAAGAAMHDGVAEGTEGLADDVGAAGEDAGAALSDGVKASTAGMADELSSAGLIAGTGLSSGVKQGAGDLEGDLEDTGTKSGAALASGAEKGTSGVKGMLSNLGVPASLLSGWGELGVGLAATGGIALDLGEKMQSANTSIATAAGTSVTAANKIGAAFLGTQGTVEFSGKEMATAFAGVAGQLKSTQGAALNTKQAMTFMSAASDLATAKQIGLKTATSTLASVMQTYQLKAKTAANASDALFEASNATGQSVTAVGKSLTRVKQSLGGLAPTLQQTSALVVDLANNGEGGRKSVSALTTAFTAFLKPAATAAKAQNDLSVATKDLTPQLASYAKQVQAGTLAGTALSKVTTGMTAKQQALWSTFTSSNTAVNTSAQAMQKMGINALTATGQLKPLKTIIGQLHTQITGMTKGQATAQLEADGFGSSAAKLVGVIQAGPAAFDKATASVSKMGSAHTAASKQSATLEVEFKTIKSAAEDWGTELGTDLMPVLKSLMGLVGTLVPIIGGVLKDAFSAIGAVVKVLVPPLDDLIKILKPAAPIILGLAAAEWVLNAAMDANPITLVALACAGLVIGIVELADHWSQVWGDIKKWFDDAVKFLRSGFGTLAIAITGPIAPLLLLALHWQQVWGFVKSVATTVWHDLDGIFHSVESDLSTIWSDITSAVQTAWNAIGSFLSGIWNGIKSAATTVWNALKAFFSKVWSDIKTVFMDASIVGLIMSHWTQIKSDATTAWDDVVNFIKTIPTKIENVFVDAGTWLLDAGKDILEGLKKGIEDGADDVINAIKKVGTDITGAFKSVLSIFSPSQVFETLGEQIPLGAAEGITAATATAVIATQTMANKIAAVPIPHIDTPQPGQKGYNALPNVTRVIATAATPTAPPSGSPMTSTNGVAFGQPGSSVAPINVTVNAQTNASGQQIGTEVGWALRTHVGV